MDVDERIPEEKIFSPTGGTFDQVGGSSYRFSCLWTCNMKFTALPVTSCFISRLICLPFLKCQAFKFGLRKDSESTFSLHFIRVPVKPSTTYRTVEIKVEFFLLESGTLPTWVTLLPAQNSVKVNYNMAHIPSFQQSIFSDLVIKCGIVIDDVWKDNFKVKYAKDKDYKNGCEHTIGARQAVRKLFLMPDHRNIVLKGSDFSYLVHGLVLAASSEYFLQEMRKILPDSNVILFENVSRSTIRSIVTYMYSQRIDIDLRNAIDIVVHAEKFGLEKLVTICLNFLRLHVNPKNASSILEIAETLNDLDLKNKATTFLQATNDSNNAKE